MRGRRPGPHMRTRVAARGHSRHTVPARTRVRGCRSVGTLAGPSPPTTAHRSPESRSRWLGRGTSRGGAAPPDRVALWWAAVVGRRAPSRPSRVHDGCGVRIAGVAAPGSPWQSVHPNPGRCHGRVGNDSVRSAPGRGSEGTLYAFPRQQLHPPAPRINRCVDRHMPYGRGRRTTAIGWAMKASKWGGCRAGDAAGRGSTNGFRVETDG